MTQITKVQRSNQYDVFLNSPVGLSLHGFFLCDRCNGSRRLGRRRETFSYGILLYSLVRERPREHTYIDEKQKMRRTFDDHVSFTIISISLVIVLTYMSMSMKPTFKKCILMKPTYMYMSMKPTYMSMSMKPTYMSIKTYMSMSMTYIPHVPDHVDLGSFTAARVKSKGHGVGDSMKPEVQVACAAGPTDDTASVHFEYFYTNTVTL